MKLIFFTLFLFASMCSGNSDEKPFYSGIFFGTGQWDADAFGNHRACVEVTEKADAVWIHIPWRRHDLNPENKNIIMVDASTGSRILNLYRSRISRMAGDLIFQPITVPGQYHIYYMPSISSGSRNYPKVIYPAPEQTAESSWLERNGLRGQEMGLKQLKRFPQARLLEIQSIDSFNSFYPMEVVALPREVQYLIKRHPEDDFLVFPETRDSAIRMTDDLPLKWKSAGIQDIFKAVAAPGEFYVFQLGVFAAHRNIDNLSLVFSGLKDKGGNVVVPPGAFRCFNLEGTDWKGNRFHKEVNVVKNKIQTLWVGFQIPDSLPEGQYQGETIITAYHVKEKKVKLMVAVKGPCLASSGDNEPTNLSRLRWLDSQLGADDTLVHPFTSLSISGHSITCLGRKVSLDDSGFPESIDSFFNIEMTRMDDKSRQLLQSPLRLIVDNASGETFNLMGRGVAFSSQDEGAVEWESLGTCRTFGLNLKARMEFDGYIEYKITLKALQKSDVRDIRLEIPLRKDAARYMMGMGYRGGFRPRSFQWTWDQKKNQDSVWIGDVNVGMQVGFRDENYTRPLNTNFYLLKPLHMPSSWFNGGRGGCRMFESDSQTFMIVAYSGPRAVNEGEELHFNFTMLLTPFKLLDTAGQWSTRYYHGFRPLAEVRAEGANTINVHHATPINPYINYPFLKPGEMKKYVDEAHTKGMKVKVYYTVRELSNHASELFAILSMGDEILASGQGGGFSWLQEHLNGNYIPGWLVPELKDAALITSGVSRWHNYYVEGVAWLVNNIGIDGIYIDDVAFDRSVMKRVRRILDGKKAGALIDLHSANQYNERDGYASSANLYLEHFPYLNRLWFGEYFDYNSPPDYWLVEISGIPFGLMGEMLQNGGNPWRGMIFGMTSRLPWSGDPRPIWKMWDDFGIQDSRMIGYWVPQSPVKANHPYVLTTSFVKKDKVLVAMASWAKEKIECRLQIDWQALAINPKTAVLTAPEIRNFQPQASFSVKNAISVEPGKGWLLILEEKKSLK